MKESKTSGQWYVFIVCSYKYKLKDIGLRSPGAIIGLPKAKNSQN
jgi:hypothetical protein